MIKLDQLGWNSFFENQQKFEQTNVVAARIIEQHSNYYKVQAESGIYIAEKSGILSYEATSQSELPVIGDWVWISLTENDGNACIKKILQRKSKFSRRSAGNRNEEQIVAANIDKLCIVTGLDHNFNLRRVERYITLAYDQNVTPVLLFNKSDLAEDLDDYIEQVDEISLSTEVFFISAKDNKGIEEFTNSLKKGETISFVGSSGVGKSTIINTIFNQQKIRTQDVRETDSKGRHTTTHKEMIMHEDGFILIDTPGIREIGLWGSTESLENTFAEIYEHVHLCRFSDCQHQNEPGCAVKQAVEQGDISQERYLSFLKQRKELGRIEEQQKFGGKKANSKKRWKSISKEIKKIRKGDYR